MAVEVLKNDSAEHAAENVTCNLCGSYKLRPWLKIDARPFYNSSKRLRDSYTIVKCEDCSLVFVKEVPTDEELKDVYGEGYYTGRDKVGYQSYRVKSRIEKLADWLLRLPRRAVRIMLRPKRLVQKLFETTKVERTRPWPHDLVDAVQSHANVGRILDVGCATGLFLVAARKDGWETKGVEFSDYSSRIARDEHNLDVVTGKLEDALNSGRLDGESFDVVTLWDTAEHVPDPMATLKASWKALKPGGVLLIKTLNLDSDRAKEEGTGWHFFRPPKHLYYYSEKTLKEYLERAGFIFVADSDFVHDVVTVVGRKPFA